MNQRPKNHAELFWPRIVLRKLFNISNKESEFSADTDDSDGESYSEDEETDRRGRESCLEDKNRDEVQLESNASDTLLPRLRRRNSETCRAQYINTKDLRICVGTWNVGGKLPPDDLDIKDWLNVGEPADMYVLGLQEIVPLNAGNIFGAEDSRPVPKWEHIIRETLNRIQPMKKKYKCYSDPPSPSRFKPSDDTLIIEDEIFLETDSDGEDEVHPLDEESNNFNKVEELELQRQFSSPKRLDRLNCFRVEDSTENAEASVAQQKRKLTRAFSGIERIGLSWPEPPLNLLAQRALERPNSFRSVRSFRTSTSFNSSMNRDQGASSGCTLLGDLDLESVMYQKRPPFVRIVSKQMVGIFITIWVRRSLRRHIQNVKVSTVGVGAMGYIGNKGSISVSMSIYQTLFCFICTHLTSGEKDGDELKRNADVQEIRRRTQFRSVSGAGFPNSILDHERIIWFGDLNYRINLPYEKTRELISKKEWSQLVERDQLVRQLKKGRAFDGWSEGSLNFPPTYKYDLNSGNYFGEDPKFGRRNPAWCDRILSFGKGMKLLNYKRIEQMFSDHRPVTASYMAEVEVFCHRKLQKALTFTDAELEDGEVIDHFEIDVGMSRLRFEEGASDWER